MRLSISLLGSFQVMLDGNAITQFGYDKVRALLAYLAVEANRPLRREQLEALLWQDQPPAAAHHSLSQALLKLRRALQDPAAASTFIQAQRGTLQFTLTEADWLDARTFVALLSEAERHSHAQVQDCDECIARLMRAAELYRGDFLEGLVIGDSAAFEDWIIIYREHFRQKVLSALEHLTRHYLARGNYDAARGLARRQLELEPYLEEAHRDLMTILARSGEHSAALAQYENCRRVLAQELGVEPSPETRGLYERLRAAGETRPHNLPLPLPALVGRERELAQVSVMLADPECRLVTLVGAGGIGKTTLALHAAQANLTAFLDGSYFISLVSLLDPAQLSDGVVGALALSLSTEGDVKKQLLEYVRPKTMLLILDNIEQLLYPPAGDAPSKPVPLAPGVKDWIVELLQIAPHVKLIVTSREPLGLHAEWQLRVPGLSYPEAAAEVTARTRYLDAYEAMRLFMGRARRVAPSFVPTAHDEYEIARLCRLLAGSPLGIELASGWLSVWSPRAIADEIERDLDFLVTDAQDVPARHRSLRQVFEHSYRLLPEPEAAILPRLAIFHTPFTRGAALKVAGANTHHLTSFALKSLLHSAAPDRYALHPLLRQFLSEKLESNTADKQATASRHSDYFADLALMLAKKSLESGQEVDVRRKRQAVIPDIAAALLWSANRRAAPFVTGLIKNLWDYYAGVGQYSVAQALFEQVTHSIPPAQELDPNQREILAYAHVSIGTCHLRVGRYDAANQHLQQALTLARGLDAPMLVSFCLSSLAGVAGDMGDHARALSLAQEALAMRRVSGDQNDVAFALYTVGTIALEAGAMAEAQTCYSEGIDIARSLGHVTTLSIAIPLGGLGVIAYRRGDPSTARTFLTQSLDVSRAIQHRWQTADSLTDLARLHADAGDYEAAEQMLVEAVEIYSAIGKRAETALALRNRAWLQECRADFVAARALYLESEALLERTLQEGRLALVRADFGRMLARAGETARSQALLARARARILEYPQPHVEIITLTGLGILERGRGNSARASNHFIEALDMAHKSQELCEGIKTLYELACLLAENERFGKAVPLFEYLFQHPATPFHIRSYDEIYRDKIAAPMGLEPSSTEQATRQAADFRTLVEWVRSGGVGVL